MRDHRKIAVSKLPNGPPDPSGLRLRRTSAAGQGKKRQHGSAVMSRVDASLPSPIRRSCRTLADRDAIRWAIDAMIEADDPMT